jgi:SPP1 family predicted phage head-tail adaptor
MINAGMFNKRIELQRTEEGGFDEEGYPIEPTVTTWELWAMIKPMEAREYVEAKATHSENITRFVIRYRKGIDSTFRINYKGNIYEIESVINDNELNETLTLMGKLVIQDG